MDGFPCQLPVQVIYELQYAIKPEHFKGFLNDSGGL